MSVGEEMHGLARELFPLCRSLTGRGVRQTLARLKELLPGLELHEVPSGTPVFDWTVPPEWNIRDAYVLSPEGERVIDFQRHNLSVVGYSIPVDRTLSLEELQPHLHSDPEMPDAIPYVTSYYRETWGFCLEHSRRQKLSPGQYRAVIDSTLAPGSLTYGELLLPGESSEEVFLSTYVCHPSMANNELSGPVVTTYLARYLAALPRRRFSYRIIFIPETIGSITYLSRNLQVMKERIRAGFNVTCVGDERAYSYLPSRAGDTLADRVALHVLRHTDPDFRRYTFLDRGSDERQYCSPGVDLPVASLMRTRYGDYPEYHTSLDDLTVVTPAGLEGAYTALRRCLDCLEHNRTYRTTVLGEPQLGRRGLYPTLSTRDSAGSLPDVMTLRNLLAYCDGECDLLQVAERIEQPLDSLFSAVSRLEEEGLLQAVGP